MSKRLNKSNNLTFGEHLDELRKMLVKISFAIVILMIFVFYFKEAVFGFLLGPCDTNFPTFDIIRNIVKRISPSTVIYPNNIELITTDISSQFMAHLSVSFYLGILLASPYILFELMKYITPALYDKEKKYAYRILIGVYALFFVGIIVSYWILFPISCRFLASYNVSPEVKALISLDSYMSLFISLTMLMGLVFQLPVIALTLASWGVIDHTQMSTYRRHAFILIVVIAAIITPPDILTLVIVSLPLYLLYEASIIGVRISCRRKSKTINVVS